MIIVAGEALVDVVTDSEGDSSESPGGSPLNVAVGLGRLEVPVTLISQVGHDERGGLVVQHVHASGAELVGPPTSTGLTSVGVARLDPSGAASYEFDIDWSLPPQELPPGHALHVGSLGTLLEPGRASVVDLVEQARARDLFVSYDVNLRESFIDDRDRVRREVHELAASCTLVKLSDEDAELLHPDLDPAETARSLLTGERTELVLLTRGAGGATAFRAGVETSASPRPVEVIDTVGAGDAFMAATLAQLHDSGVFTSPDVGLPSDEDALVRLMRGSMEVAAITCERRGANPPRRQELPEGWPA